MPRKSAGNVHGAQGMDKAGVFGRGIDPPGALQLINVPQALDPGRVDQILFRLLPVIGRRIGNSKGNIFMDRIGDQGRTVVGRRRFGRRQLHGPGTLASS